MLLGNFLLSVSSLAVTSAVICLERLITEITYHVSSKTLNSTHKFTYYADTR